mmetsp:Transcript_29006/g.64866  ORF Transcript_29006/g.64866 Transcript_29006/m.64866 type:complete len:242 (+) Transcript_29006:514-1239(+)
MSTEALGGAVSSQGVGLALQLHWPQPSRHLPCWPPPSQNLRGGRGVSATNPAARRVTRKRRHRGPRCRAARERGTRGQATRKEATRSWPSTATRMRCGSPSRGVCSRRSKTTPPSPASTTSRARRGWTWSRPPSKAGSSKAGGAAQPSRGQAGSTWAHPSARVQDGRSEGGKVKRPGRPLAPGLPRAPSPAPSPAEAAAEGRQEGVPRRRRRSMRSPRDWSPRRGSPGRLPKPASTHGKTR